MAGSVGAVAGAAAGKLAEPAADMVIDLFDEVVLDGLLRGWKPRNYFDKIVSPKD